ncbi:MAG: hypothetical protein JSS12_11350 [Verrucomicrobia bacterium]|nr:hypothetical protein [Verrucomicrobiota bacterium]
MKHFMIWPILVPAIAFCQDDVVYHDEVDTNVSSVGWSSGGSWNTKDHDDFLQMPSETSSGGTVLTVDGTITDQTGDGDIYDAEYDMNDE